ncbi:hypothetical protein FHR76_004631 [Rhizobium sp. RAS22]|nr:hypothetical protein [Rhizobium sp. RAS22]
MLRWFNAADKPFMDAGEKVGNFLSRLFYAAQPDGRGLFFIGEGERVAEAIPIGLIGRTTIIRQDGQERP